MAKKKRVYIQGNSPPQKFSDGKPTAVVSSFWHIKRPRAQFRTLCGMDYDTIIESREKPKGKKQICTFCIRIADGRDPVFDSAREQRYEREEHVGPKGTVANPQHVQMFARRGQVLA